MMMNYLFSFLAYIKIDKNSQTNLKIEEMYKIRKPVLDVKKE
jgi:hypothetical protein